GAGRANSYRHRFCAGKERKLGQAAPALHVRPARRGVGGGPARFTQPGMELPLPAGGRLEFADALLLRRIWAGDPPAPGAGPDVRPARILRLTRCAASLGLQPGKDSGDAVGVLWAVSVASA